MTPEEYAATQAAISAAVAAYVTQFAGWFTGAALSAGEWLSFLQLLYPLVERYRRESAVLGRQFYDSQRSINVPELPRNDVFLVGYQFEDFVRAVEPVRQQFMLPDSPPAAKTQLSLISVREVENAGRRQIISAVEHDQDLQDFLDDTQEPVKPQKLGKRVRGWARVATGRETCAWCLMLISRGPVYYQPARAGLKVEAWEAKEMIAEGIDVSKYMEEWHTGCDCKVVPVFKDVAWDGQEAADRALDLYVKASKRAKAELRDNPDKKYYSFKDNQWKKTTNARETINQLRKMIESGEIDNNQWAALSAA